MRLSSVAIPAIEEKEGRKILTEGRREGRLLKEERKERKESY